MNTCELLDNPNFLSRRLSKPQISQSSSYFMMVPKLQTLSDGNITLAFTAFNDAYHTPAHELNTITKNVFFSNWVNLMCHSNLLSKTVVTFKTFQEFCGFSLGFFHQQLHWKAVWIIWPQRYVQMQSNLMSGIQSERVRLRWSLCQNITAFSLF